MDKICGIDRYEHSPTYGEQVVDVAILWIRPGAPFKDVSVSGAIKHGDAVEVLEKKQYKQELWCKVSCTKYADEQAGWLKATLLEEEGKGQEGIKHGEQKGNTKVT